MPFAAHPSSPPPAPHQRPRTLPISSQSNVFRRVAEPSESLRAGGPPKTLNPLRTRGRVQGAADLREAVDATPHLSMEDVAEAMGLPYDREHDEIKSGKIPVTWGEFVDLTPLPVFVRALAIAIPRRIARDRAAGVDTSALELVRFHVEALRSLL